MAEVKTAFDNAIVSVMAGSTGMDMFSGLLSFVADNLDTVISLVAGLGGYFNSCIRWHLK